MASRDVNCFGCMAVVASAAGSFASIMKPVILRQASIRNLMALRQLVSLRIINELGPYLSLTRSLSSNDFRNCSSFSCDRGGDVSVYYILRFAIQYSWILVKLIKIYINKR